MGEDAAPSRRGRHLGLYHFGLKVGDSDDELREAVARLEEAGVPIVGASDHTVTHSLYILDPDGNEIELYIDVPGVDWKADPEPDHGPDQAPGPLSVPRRAQPGSRGRPLLTQLADGSVGRPFWRIVHVRRAMARTRLTGAPVPSASNCSASGVTADVLTATGLISATATAVAVGPAISTWPSCCSS